MHRPGYKIKALQSKLAKQHKKLKINLTQLKENNYAAAVSPKQTYPRSAHERVTVLHSPRRRRLASAESSSWNTSAPGTVPRSKAPVVGHTLRRFEFEAPGGRSANEASDS